MNALGLGVREELQDVALARFGNGEHHPGAADRAAHHEPGVVNGRGVRQVFGKAQVNAVVDGDHGLRAEQQGQNIVRFVEELSSELANLPGQAPVLAQGVSRGLIQHGNEVFREVLEGRNVLVMAEQEIRVLVVDQGQGADNVPHIRANAVVPPLAGINRDSRHGPKVARERVFERNETGRFASSMRGKETAPLGWGGPWRPTRWPSVTRP